MISIDLNHIYLNERYLIQSEIQYLENYKIRFQDME